MKTNNYIKLVIIFLGMSFIYSCSNESINQENGPSDNGIVESHSKGQADAMDDVSAPNILQVAIGSKDHTTLVAAVQAAEIEHILVNVGPLTVFAPTNAAFDALPEGTVENLLKPENKNQLATILTMHAAPGSYDLDALKREARKGRKIYTATGDYFEVIVEGEDVYVGGAKILGTVSTSNGIIQVVESLLTKSE
jgi:uncharacterized surface protein with fasciclin (FAS1) repeats